MFDYFKKSFLLFLCFCVLPSIYAMEDGYLNKVSRGISSIFSTIVHDSKKFVQSLIFYPYLREKINQYDYTIHGSFHRAMETGNVTPENVQIIQRYLEKGYSPNIIIGKDKKTPLHFAVKHGNSDVVNLLLKYKAKVDASDAHKLSPLCLAYEPLLQNKPAKFDSQIVNSLLEHKANPNIVVGSNKETPLTLSMKYSNDVIHSLLQNSADVNSCNSYEETPVSIVTNNILVKKDDQNQEINYKIFAELLQRKPNINWWFGKNENEQTPLTQAIIHRDVKLINFLLENKADVNASNKDGHTPLSLIIHNILRKKDDQKTNYVILKQLLEYKSNINACITKYGETALIRAVRHKNLDLVNFLLENNADVHVPSKNKNYKGEKKEEETALLIAIENILHDIFVSEKTNVNYLILGKILYNTKKDAVEKGFTVDCFKIPLIEAIKKQDIVLTNLLLHYNVGINDCDGYENTPLSTAVQKACKTNNSNDLKIIKRLLECKADPNIKIGYDKKTPLMFAAKSQNLDVVKLLLQCKETDVNTPDEYGETSFYYAYNAQKDFGFNKQIIKCLLEHGANPNIKMMKLGQDTPLMEVIRNQDLEMFELLLKCKADVNADNYYSSPLSIAVNQNNLKIAETLLLLKADPDDRHCPLIKAVRNKNLDMIKLLLTHEAYINIYSDNGETPLSTAIETCNLPAIKYLLKQGADPNINIDSARAKIPLLMAIKRQNLDMIELLLEYKANINVFYNGDTPVSTAIETGNLQTIESLLRRGANPNLNQSKLPLSLAIKRDNLDMINLFLKYKANVNNIDMYNIFFKRYKTPIATAIRNDKFGAIKILCHTGAQLEDVKNGETIFDLLVSKNKSKEHYMTVITHARFDQEFHQKYNDPIKQAIELMLIFKNKEKEGGQATPSKDLYNLILSKLHQDDSEVFKNKISRELFIITCGDSILNQVNNNVKHLLYIVKKSKNSALAHGLDLEKDFNAFVMIFSDISKSNKKLNVTELIAALESKLDQNNLALQMYKNCALKEGDQ